MSSVDNAASCHASFIRDHILAAAEKADTGTCSAIMMPSGCADQTRGRNSEKATSSEKVVSISGGTIDHHLDSP
jgi:hypothetical protein